jgi:hypothetical protein
MTLIEALREKFQRQMKAGGYGALTHKQALALSRKFKVTVADVSVAAKRFGVLIDDPYATKVTSYTSGSKSPHGICYNPETGQVYCEANLGYANRYYEWVKPAAKEKIAVEMQLKD